jgi:hypothetical protein
VATHLPRSSSIVVLAHLKPPVKTSDPGFMSRHRSDNAFNPGTNATISSGPEIKPLCNSSFQGLIWCVPLDRCKNNLWKILVSNGLVLYFFLALDRCDNKPLDNSSS